MTKPDALIVVVGPTATGKTALAVELAERLGGEIVSADSVQVYRHFDIGAGKPSEEELARAPHHLLSIVEPFENLEAQRWAEIARETIGAIRTRGKVPIVCGGTFLWVRALIHGLAEAPPGDAAIRARHLAWAEAEGRVALHVELKKVDPELGTRLHENDFVRVSRALEVFELTGRRLSEIQAEHGFRQKLYEPRYVGVAWEREAHDARIAERVRGMLHAGLVAEVEGLLAQGFAEARAMDSVGYRQVRLALGAETAQDLDALHGEIVRATRIFSRRQRTWLREENVRYVPLALLGTAELGVLAEELRKE